MIVPAKGLRFLHSRVLDPSAMPERKPQLFVVTCAARRGSVYYASIHQRRDDAGNVYREDIGGSQCCPIADFHRYCLVTEADAARKTSGCESPQGPPA